MTTYKIVTIDDSSVIRKIINKAFQPFDCVVSEAENGAEGLVVIHRDKPDLVILDLTMPVMNGIEMLEKVKSDPAVKDIPVIMLTAESSKDVVVQIIKLGVKDYISKPFQGDQLMERVRKYLSLEEKKVCKFFVKDNDIDIIVFPDKMSSQAATEIKEQLNNSIKDGAKKIITDMSKDDALNSSAIQLIGFILSSCKKAQIKPLVVAKAMVAKELKEYEETASAITCLSLDEAKKNYES
ncbi:response regulator [Legionella worsleiensis]|uniref:Two component response regulator n=1 Tax=Legionella worsleiensis TaxID=45076 RepID=A0A0W1A4B5_9GAMM|nr:response regulator [Legionella worsleiensis]KTD76204.1 two component response regulator [Legionella worsleiensis]STY33220.1 two-component system, OmpR family, copper resistance phosphate regulon response regulator CusR [Legionella worsleiensis]